MKKGRMARKAKPVDRNPRFFKSQVIIATPSPIQSSTIIKLTLLAMPHVKKNGPMNSDSMVEKHKAQYHQSMRRGK